MRQEIKKEKKRKQRQLFTIHAFLSTKLHHNTSYIILSMWISLHSCLILPSYYCIMTSAQDKARPCSHQQSHLHLKVLPTLDWQFYTALMAFILVHVDMHNISNTKSIKNTKKTMNKAFSWFSAQPMKMDAHTSLTVHRLCGTTYFIRCPEFWKNTLLSDIKPWDSCPVQS